MAVEIGLLGEVAARVDGRAVDLGPARQRCVLAALAVDVDQVVSADRLVERVWGADPPRRAQATLSSYVSRLRQVLGGTVSLVRRSGGYALVAERTAVDLHRFRDLRSRAMTAAGDDARAHELLAAAAGVWRGEALTGLGSAWAAAERDRLHQERFVVECDLTDVRLRLGQGEQLVAELSLRAAEHPLDERVAGQYLLALYRGRRAADALEHYQRFRVRLVSELGADPGPALRELHRRILNADPALLPAPPRPAPTAAPPAPVLPVVTPRQLPAAPTSFVGRHDELAALDENLDRSSRTVVISAIAGSGGIGKTWLALHWAHRYASRFPDGQLFVDLRGFGPDRQPMDPSVAIRGFLDALGVEPGRVPVAPHAQGALFRSLVADRRLLIVLDNAVDTAQVAPLLPGTDSCLVLVTSRNQLSGLISGHGAEHVALDVLGDDEARRLLATRLGPARTAAEASAVDELVRLCGGLPLALSVIAARARMKPDVPLGALAAELRDLGLRALDDDPAAGITTVLSWSHRALTAEQATAFGLLGLAPGPDIDQHAAANLTGLEPCRALAVLRDLEQASLVARDARGRYRMHDLVRRYAAETARRDLDPADLDAALHRVVDFYLHTAHTGHRALDPAATPVDVAPPAPGCHPLPLADDLAAVAWFDAEHGCLLAVQDTAAALGRWTVVWQLAMVMTSFHVRRGHLHDNLRLWRGALAAADRDPDPATRVLVHRNVGFAHAKVHRHEEAMRHLDRAVALAGATGDGFLLAHTHIALAWAWELHDDVPRALEHSLKALDVLRAGDNRAREAVALNMVGWYYALLDVPDRASEHCRAALALHRAHGDRNGVAATLDSLGYIARSAGRHEQALECYQEALGLFRELDHTYGAAEALEGIGHPLAALGRPDEARAAWVEAAGLFRSQRRDVLAARVESRLARLDHLPQQV
ncbi:AfsR/SARP family transcriptional regulator [Saccharothrix yanglingensis]|uniref:Transcriptional regulator, SARP family protein n=1 Tax=Saccharothrix yanglingensis TaxID=659496 RepID=A0ABU0X1D5_9PSEU|nr:BTAD domain-containing putative transcriptional regulator [Saccharothrix yanglingensis]MDQ2585558.1 transcriptional regulator, SARP family protein [Saccharothrix yanglingensis]